MGCDAYESYNIMGRFIIWSSPTEWAPATQVRHDLLYVRPHVVYRTKMSPLEDALTASGVYDVFTE